LLRGLTFYLGSIAYNIYQFPQTRGPIKSIRYTGKLISEGWNIAIFPEGERTRGKMIPFKQGIGLLAVEMKVPIVPIKLEGVGKMLPINANIPRFSKVHITIGKPITIKEDSYIAATKHVEKVMRAL